MNVSNGDLMMIDGAEHALTLTYGKNVKALYEQSECFFFCLGFFVLQRKNR